MAEAMIDMQHITMKYGDLTVLNDISLQIAEGSKTVIIGPSGAGKSTFLRCINLFEKPYSGTVTVNGQNLTGVKNKDLYKARQDIGMVFQSFNLYAHKTVLENLIFAPIKLKHENKEDVIKRAMENLKKVGLESKKDSFPSQLSGGQQQRVAIARALTMQPKVILFDEPTSALDPEMISEVLHIMEEVAKENITMVFVTHEMGFARQIADRLLFLEGGHIMEDDTPENVIMHPKHERTKQFFSKILK